MKAAVVVAGDTGPWLRIQTVPDPIPGPHDLVVSVKAAGLNRTDLALRQRHFATSSLHIAGLEAAGEVIAVGAEVRDFRAGDRVMGMCAAAYAERVLIDHRTALRIPDGLSWSKAAAIPVWFLTAHDALITNGRLAPGETVLIQAVASGIGLASVQVAKAMGAALAIGTSRSTDKLERVKAQIGLDVAIDTGREDFVARTRDFTDGKGVDVIIDNIGGSVLKGNIDALALRGRLVSVGRLNDNLAEIDLDLLALKRLTLSGVTFRTRTVEEKMAVGQAAMRDLGPLIESGRLWPIVDREYALDEAVAAQDYMRSNVHFGKVVLTV
jgi:NADPH2:quinone reductase